MKGSLALDVEREGRLTIGVDEVGRGCLAGPVVAAAVIFPVDFSPLITDMPIIRDSKTLSREQRKIASEWIRSRAQFSIAEVSAEEIDAINIHRASLEAMKRAVTPLLSKEGMGVVGASGAIILVDGRFTIPELSIAQEAIIDGDAKVFSISAASIVAKEYRDQLMEKLDSDHPVYGFARHKGYATAEHRKAILEHGLCVYHRKTFCH